MTEREKAAVSAVLAAQAAVEAAEAALTEALWAATRTVGLGRAAELLYELDPDEENRRHANRLSTAIRERRKRPQWGVKLRR